MDVNITLIIQAINFLLAFVFLKYILLIPLLKFIKKSKAEKSARLHCILNLEESVEQQLGYKADRWRSFQKNFLKGVPVISDRDDEDPFLISSSYMKQVKDEEVKELSTGVEDFIIEKVLDGNL